MKKLIIAISICFLLKLSADTNATKKVSSATMKTRQKLAVEIISSDEGFLEEYSDRLTEDQMIHFLNMAFQMAEKAALQTVDIEDDNDAYQMILSSIESRNGVKSQVRSQIEFFLKSHEKASFSLEKPRSETFRSLENIQRSCFQKNFAAGF